MVKNNLLTGWADLCERFRVLIVRRMISEFTRKSGDRAPAISVGPWCINTIRGFSFASVAQHSERSPTQSGSNPEVGGAVTGENPARGASFTLSPITIPKHCRSRRCSSNGLDGCENARWHGVSSRLCPSRPDIAVFAFLFGFNPLFPRSSRKLFGRHAFFGCGPGGFTAGEPSVSTQTISATWTFSVAVMREHPEGICAP